MNVVKQDLFCPACGAKDVHVDEGDPGDYYAGTSHYCLTCHSELPDLGEIKDITREPPLIDAFQVGKYVEIREAAGRDDAETQRMRALRDRAKAQQDTRNAVYYTRQRV